MWYEKIQYKKSMPLKILLVGKERTEDYWLYSNGDHWHSAIEIILVLNGTINIIVEGEGKNLEAGEMLLINSNCGHSSEVISEDNLHIVFQINPDFISGYYEDIKHYIEFSPDSQKEVNRNVYEYIRSCAARIVLEYKDKKDAYEIAVIGLLNDMLASIIRFYPHNLHKNNGYPMKEENLKRLDRIMSYINENLSNDIIIADIASKEHLSVTYLSHFIKNHIGMSMRDYIMTKRIEKAKFLILSSKKSISQIGEECGFSNYQTFSKMFKKRVKTSPSNYRKIYILRKNDFEELCKITYEYNDMFNLDKGEHTLQDFDSNVGLAFGHWGVPINWNTLVDKVGQFVIGVRFL
ncbi:transcriptional regulator with cupin sensor, AraC family [Clostridium sp. DL-VIII]|uniref:AraC family transcriptional regulator n=1 Tax=Clostridium sp. DL-VIII TaxID=641107 RepID=UPI00023AFA54|nr:AraC family transcriptional regulator [Clostridium sp. DL-VIII]EHI98768.1 transcriptional regulator with cupin sensor, AraC family [Clostridium sp. DL-VIII]